MWQEYRSVEREIKREENFTPPFCINPKCSQHFGGVDFTRHARIKLKRFPYLSIRFRCKECMRTFSASSFRLDYRQRVWGLNDQIFKRHQQGVSIRETARELHCTEHLVRIRKIKMQRFALLKHIYFSRGLKIEEPIVYDGLENFAFSQYQPNNINHAVGKNSLFIYDFNFAALNRKGRMSSRQIERSRHLNKLHGKFPKNTISIESAKLFRRLEKRGMDILLTDRHYEYKNALREINFKGNHITVSSKIARNFKNKLFAINNIDMQTRHNLSAFKRETIAFSKHSIAMLESYSLHAVYRNYMRPKFWKKHRSDPTSNKMSPAMKLGLTNKIFSFQEFFSNRVPVTHLNLHEDYSNLYHRIDTLSRQKIAVSASI